MPTLHALTLTMPFPVLILGATSNIILIQNAERRAHATVTFWEFAKIGAPLTVAQTVTYWGWIILW